MRKKIFHIACAILFISTLPAQGGEPELGTNSALLSSEWRGEVIGAQRFHTIGPEETLMELARDQLLGYTNVKNANPDIDPWNPPQGKIVLLPCSSILPLEANPGITINLAEMRLYHIWREAGQYHASTYALGIGSEGTESPTGQFSILDKAENPTWTVPLSIRQERPEMPAKVPPGPANPLGKYWMKFSREGFGIHGTNKPLGVGRRVSHGCMRLYPQGIQDLFYRVSVGTPVLIINNPIKVGKKDATLFLEAHCQGEKDIAVLKREIVRQARLLNWGGVLDWDGIERILKESRGVPLPISAVENPTTLIVYQ